MNIRAMTIQDMDSVNELHDKFFGHQFDKTDFMKNFLNAFVIENEGSIVMAGGVRPIAEAILVTDKEANPHTLGKALLEALEVSRYTCRRFNIEFLHAFVKDHRYEKHLIAHGFTRRCQALSMEV
jgi:DNA-directed RNA polymerase subunit N (RpoN/RPB10)